MDRQTKAFLKAINGQLHDTSIPLDMQKDTYALMMQQAKWDEEFRTREARKAQQLKEMAQYTPTVEDCKDILAAFKQSVHKDKTPDLSTLGKIPEGKQELETLRDMALEKKAELDEKVDSLLLAGRSGEYWDSLKEREIVEKEISFYDEQLKALG